MKKLMFVVAAALALSATATQYSRLAVKHAAQKYGKWDALEQWLVAAGFYEDFRLASNLSDEYPQFPAITNAIVQAGLATTSEIETILAESVDTAVPDAFLMAKYNRDMQTESGRKNWHGKQTTYIDTNDCLRVYVYEDGYRYTVPWQRPQSEIEKRLAKAQALVKAAERSSTNKPLAVRSLIMKRAESEAYAITNGAVTVTVDAKTGTVVDKKSAEAGR